MGGWVTWWHRVKDPPPPYTSMDVLMHKIMKHRELVFQICTQKPLFIYIFNKSNTCIMK